MSAPNIVVATSTYFNGNGNSASNYPYTSYVNENDTDCVNDQYFSSNPVLTSYKYSTRNGGRTGWVLSSQPVTWTLGGDDSSYFSLEVFGLNWSGLGNWNGHPSGLDGNQSVELFSSELNFENPLDKNGDNIYEINVVATNEAGISSVVPVKITVVNINEAAQLTGSQTSLNDSLAGEDYIVTEEALVSGWSDPEGDTISIANLSVSVGTLSETTVNGLSAWKITDIPDNFEGNISISYSLNSRYESVSTYRSFSVLLDNPYITGPSGIASAGSSTSSKSINENYTSVHTFSANETVTWSLNGGADATLFSINSSTGVLSFSSAPDYETPSDSDSNNSYFVVVRATDSAGNTSDQTLTVSIADSNELNISNHNIGTSYHLEYIRDFDGNLHANSGSVSDELKNSYKYQGNLDVNNDGVMEAIYTNKVSGRWVAGKILSGTNQIDFSDYGTGGGTRVVGIYDDPLISVGLANNGFLSDGTTPAPAAFGATGSDRYTDLNGDGDFNDDNEDRLALNSQVRFQNDLLNDNLSVKASGDYDGDGYQEVYWKTNDGDVYLRSLMHADGNIQYANYQSEEQMSDYLTNNGYQSVISDIV